MTTYVYVDQSRGRPGFGGPPSFGPDGKPQRKPIQRRVIDHTASIITHLQNRVFDRDQRDAQTLQPTLASTLDVLPPAATPESAANSFTTKFVHVSTNKHRSSVNVCCWTPDGKRLVTGSANGQFTIWNGQSFNYDNLLPAHDNVAVRSMCWSHSDNWLISGDDAGTMKVWKNIINPVKVATAHNEPVRAISFAPTDMKFCSASDDTTLKIWDFARFTPELVLSGHGGDVKDAHWHPTKALVASCSKDTYVKLWDAKAGTCVATLMGHKGMVVSSRWNNNGNWIVTAGRDQMCKVFDIRMLKDLQTYRGHNRDCTCVSWHPFHEELFVSGGYDGSMLYWMVGSGEAPVAEVRGGHEAAVWSIAWHPFGHILCTGSNDNTAKFWARNRLGEVPRDTSQRGGARADREGGSKPSGPQSGSMAGTGLKTGTLGVGSGAPKQDAPRLGRAGPSPLAGLRPLGSSGRSDGPQLPARPAGPVVQPPPLGPDGLPLGPARLPAVMARPLGAGPMGGGGPQLPMGAQMPMGMMGQAGQQQPMGAQMPMGFGGQQPMGQQQQQQPMGMQGQMPMGQMGQQPMGQQQQQQQPMGMQGQQQMPMGQRPPTFDPRQQQGGQQGQWQR